MQLIDSIFIILVVIMSAVVHEVMHGVAANSLGDPTARLQGRLTLNPLVHLDPFGSVLLPAVLALTGSPVLFGWAKPVPYNPYNLRPGRFSEAIVAGAGPASNAAIAIIAALLLRAHVFDSLANTFLFLILLVNVMLCVFNLIPIPPLDGSKILSAILPSGLARAYDRLRTQMEMNPFMGMGVVLVVILLLGGAFGTFIWNIAHSLAGM